MKYSADDIIVNKWAELKQTLDGKWNSIWDIVLKKSIAETSNLEDISIKLSHEGFDVRVKVREGKHLTVSVTTERSERDDDILFATFKMFEDIERLLGTIDTIQGQKMEDRWSPYRLSKKTVNS